MPEDSYAVPGMLHARHVSKSGLDAARPGHARRAMGDWVVSNDPWPKVRCGLVSQGYLHR